jgi:hypothetical protein
VTRKVNYRSARTGKKYASTIGTKSYFPACPADAISI